MQKKIMTIVRMTIMMIIAQMAEPEKATMFNFSPKKSQNLDPPFRRRVRGPGGGEVTRSWILTQKFAQQWRQVSVAQWPTARCIREKTWASLDKMSPSNKVSNCVRCQSRTISHYCWKFNFLVNLFPYLQEERHNFDINIDQIWIRHH